MWPKSRVVESSEVFYFILVSDKVRSYNHLHPSDNIEQTILLFISNTIESIVAQIDFTKISEDYLVVSNIERDRVSKQENLIKSVVFTWRTALNMNFFTCLLLNLAHLLPEILFQAVVVRKRVSPYTTLQVTRRIQNVWGEGGIYECFDNAVYRKFMSEVIMKW